MLATVVIIVVILAVSGLALYAMRNKVRFKVSATALKWFSVNIEVEADDRRQVSELPPDGASDVGRPRPRVGKS